uniref:Uncharacterized protein n=1 Tax=Manihot esculenta TaxID=3983 RepID=A0A2C9UK89_MANES
MLALLADALIEIREQESDWQEIDKGDAKSDKNLFSAANTSFGRLVYDQLEAIAKAFDEVSCHKISLLFLINLASYLSEFYARFSNGNRVLFDHLCQGWTQAQKCHSGSA